MNQKLDCEIIIDTKVAEPARSDQIDWVAPEWARLDLLYLAHGHRQFGRYPVPVSRRAGWQYVLITRGEPTLLLEDGARKLRPGHLLIIPPGCATGWADSPDAISELLLWIWRKEPNCAECTTPRTLYRQWAINPRLWKKLEQLHTQCYEEVERPDELSYLTLEQLHVAVDVAITRLIRPKARAPDPSVRMELAVHWMAHNLAECKPNSSLCEYLRISPATLVRMFQAQRGESPSDYYQRLRMARARELLKIARWSVKDVAATLGYRHPNDFSRAFKRATGKNPTDG
jgi:AraC-like DNA-binding protein